MVALSGWIRLATLADATTATACAVVAAEVLNGTQLAPAANTRMTFYDADVALCRFNNMDEDFTRLPPVQSQSKLLQLSVARLPIPGPTPDYREGYFVSAPLRKSISSSHSAFCQKNFKD
ncbi:hypothetical protein BD413DRAFT_614873 [Trametes elegans]|nr:hypothetical protein BD413DRAFT_614873 [Trametes elegans]